MSLEIEQSNELECVYNNEEINSYSGLLYYINDDTINNNGKYLNNKFLKIFQDEYVYFKQLKNA
jgi:hypothetical protein